MDDPGTPSKKRLSGKIMADCSISIVIPAYNVENYLGEAIDSIKAQDTYPDEVILIDDGSTDRTLEIANSFSFSFPYKVVSIENGGQGNARNLGVSLASSEYIYFFDSDDLLTKDFIKFIKEQLEQKYFPDIILFSGESFNDRKYKGNRWANYSRGFSGSFDDRVSFLDRGLSTNGLFCSPCLYVSKKSLWGKKGLNFGPNYFEDDAIFYPLIFSCSSFLVVDDVFFLRRNREGSTMTITPNARHVNGALNYVQTTLSLYSSPTLTTRERWHVKRRLAVFCICYILIARNVGLKVSYSLILRSIIKTKNVRLALRAFLFGVHADQSNSLCTLGRLINKMRAWVRRKFRIPRKTSPFSSDEN